MRGNIKNIFRKNWWDIILICLFGLLSITWFQGSRLIAIADFWFPSDGISYLSKMMYTWKNTYSLGTGTFKGMATVFYGAYLALTNIIGLSTVASEKIFFYINFIAAGMSMYYLSYVIGLRRPWRVVSALFYMMNPVAIDFFRTFAVYSFAPLLLGLYINGLEQRKKLSYIILLVLIWLITTTYMYVDPGYGAVLLFAFFLYLIFYIITHRDIKLAIEGVRFTIILLLFFLFLNAFWMVPLGLNLSSELQRTTVPNLNNERLYCGLSAILLNGFRLLGYGKSLLSTYKGDLLFQWVPWYFQRSTVLISLLISVIVFLPLLSRDKKRKYSYYFSFLAILGLFLITGANFPFGQFKFWLVKEIPYALPAFRNPLKFQLLIALSFAPLLGKGISIVYKFLLQKWHRLLANLVVVAICFILFGYYSFPYWTGSIFRKGGEVIPSDRIEIPDYYSNAREWLDHSLENFRILPLPMSKVYNSAYTWESGFSGPNPDSFLLNKPTITHNDGSQGYQVVLMIGKATEEPNLKVNISRLLGLLNVRYIMLHRDTNWEYIKGHRNFFNTDLKSLLVFIQHQSGIHLVKSFSKLDFYKTSDEYFLPHVYASSDKVGLEDYRGKGLAE